MKKLVLLALATVGLMVAVPFAAAAAGSSGELMIIGLVMTASAFVQPQITMNLGSSIDITELATKLGDYFREHRDVLVSETLLSDDFRDRFEVMDGVGDEVPLPNLSITSIVKPANPLTFSPTSNALKFGARTLKVRGMKIDLQLVPEVLMKTWLGKLKKPDDILQMPFEAFVMNYIMEKAREDIYLNAIYSGVYNAAGTTPGATMNGYKKIIADEITATNITPVVTGAISSTNIIDKVEQTYDALGEAYKGKPSEMKAAPVLFDWYNRRYRGEHGANNNYEGMKRGRVLIDGTNCELVREPALAGSQRLICTPKENMVWGSNSKDFVFDFQKFERTIKVLGDFKGGVEFKEIHARALAVNDQA